MKGEVPFPHRFVELGDAVLVEHRGIIDQKIQRTERAGCLGNEPGDGTDFGKISPESDGLGAAPSKTRRKRLRLGERPVGVNGDRETMRRQILDYCPADASRTAGNERRLECPFQRSVPFFESCFRAGEDIGSKRWLKLSSDDSFLKN